MGNEISLEKKARALCASVRLKDQYFDDKIETALAKQFDLTEAMVSTMILKKFLGDEYWKVKELQYRKNEYAEKTKEERSFEYRPMSVRDYFNIPTQYHFYKFIQRIALTLNATNQQNLFDKSNKMHSNTQKRTVPFINNGKPFEALADLIENAYESYANLEATRNMCFSRSDIKINIDGKPIGSYRSLRKLASDRANESGLKVIQTYELMKKEFESEVFDFMVDYVLKKQVSNSVTTEIIENKNGSDYLGFSTIPATTYFVEQNQQGKQCDEHQQISIKDYIKRVEELEKKERDEETGLKKGVVYFEEDGQLKFSHFKKVDNPLRGFEDSWENIGVDECEFESD